MIDILKETLKFYKTESKKFKELEKRNSNYHKEINLKLNKSSSEFNSNKQKFKEKWNKFS